MKNIIDGKLKVCVTGDNMENIQVRELEKKCGFYIDETYIAEEDGEVLIDGELVPFKAGDILAIYGTWLKVTAMDQSIRQLLFLVQISWLFR